MPTLLLFHENILYNTLKIMPLSITLKKLKKNLNIENTANKL